MSDFISKLQAGLKAAGYLGAEVEAGVFDSHTTTAFRAFARKHPDFKHFETTRQPKEGDVRLNDLLGLASKAEAKVEVPSTKVDAVLTQVDTKPKKAEKSVKPE